MKDAEEKEFWSYSIITTEPNNLVSNIHDRMPAILDQKNEDSWLEQTTPLPKILDLLKPYPAEEMVSWPVSNPPWDPDQFEEGVK
ncbi:MAG TPA: SOS response-associated peptidase family protein [Candidatus Bathyarchaeia archaeon]|nr:SOS response-associated peptidase family protein [Candidatus Bathyarchaeia archaeon]